MKINWVKLAVAIIIPQAAGMLGGLATASSVKEWYLPQIIKPSIAPPAWVFAPVWTLLFLLMGIALYIVWQKKKVSNWFWVQLALNVLWSLLFFGWRRPDLALGEIFILWLAIFKTIRDFYKVDKRAGKLLIPYILWVSFASYLNYLIVSINY